VIGIASPRSRHAGRGRRHRHRYRLQLHAEGPELPAGLAPITLSPRALDKLRARSVPARSFYFDLKLLDEYFQGAHRYHHTAPVTMFYALREALAVIAEEGLEKRFERHRRNHLALVAGLEALGLRMHVTDPHSASGL